MINGLAIIRILGIENINETQMPQSIEFVFGTKAETLRRLGPLLNESSVPDLVYFSTRDWIEKPSYLIQLIQETFGAE